MPEVIKPLEFEVKGDTSKAQNGLYNLAKIVDGLKTSVSELTSALKLLSGTEKQSTAATDSATKAKKSHLQQLLAAIKVRQQEANVTNASTRVTLALARANANVETSERLKAQATLESSRANRQIYESILEAEKAKRMDVQATLESAKANRMDVESSLEAGKAIRMESQAAYELERAKRFDAQSIAESSKASRADAQATFEEERAKKLSAQASSESAKANKANAQAAYDNARANELIARAAAAQEKAQKAASRATAQDTKETAKNAKEHKKAGNSAHHHASGLTRLAAALKRILIYRAIRGVIKAVTGAINEGIERMYAWSEANDQVFMRVMDTYATEVQYLKDAIGAALSPLIEMLMPYLVQLVDWFVELINVVNQFFRALAGYDTWLKVDKVAAKFKTDTEGAAKAQKALNSQLMDFDQLNLITTPKSSGKTETETPGLSGHYTDIDPAIKEAAAKFKKFLEPFKELKGILADIWKEFEPLLAPFIDGTFEIAAQFITLIKDTVANLKDNGVFTLLAQIIGDINDATLNLVKEVLGLFGDVILRLSQSKGFKLLLAVIGKITSGSLERLAKVISDLRKSGAIDKLMDGVDVLLGGVALFLDALDDVSGWIFDLVGKLLPWVVGALGQVFTFVGQILGNIGTGLSGIFEMIADIFGLSSDASFWNGLYKVIQGFIINPVKNFLSMVTDYFDWFDTILWEYQKATHQVTQTQYDAHKAMKKTVQDFKTTVDDSIWTSAAAAEKIAVSGQKKASETTEKWKASMSSWQDESRKVTTEVLGDLDKIGKKMEWFAKGGKTWGAEFRKGFISELEPLNKVTVTMQPGQQGSWNKTKVTMTTMAEGGFPDMGTMFVAGEAGAEMVGTINGRTGVASGEEITGIAEAVYGSSAEERIVLNQILNAIRSQNLTISPSASLGKVVNQSQRLYQGVTG